MEKSSENALKKTFLPGGHNGPPTKIIGRKSEKMHRKNPQKMGENRRFIARIAKNSAQKVIIKLTKIF